jgi:hypothetical protein
MRIVLLSGGGVQPNVAVGVLMHGNGPRPTGQKCEAESVDPRCGRLYRGQNSSRMVASRSKQRENNRSAPCRMNRVCGEFPNLPDSSVFFRHQLLILNRGRKRAPNLRFSDRLISGLCNLLMRPAAILRTAIVLKPSTLQTKVPSSLFSQKSE